MFMKYTRYKKGMYLTRESLKCFFSQTLKQFACLCIKIEKMFNIARLIGVLGGQKVVHECSDPPSVLEAMLLHWAETNPN